MSFSPAQPWYVIVNPSAGSGQGKKRWPAIQRELDRQQVSFEYRISPDAQAITHMVPELITQGARKFIAVGGDGTFHQMINAIFAQTAVHSKQFSVGIIPVGTGNDWIRSYGIGSNMGQSIEVIKKGNTIFQDIGLIESDNFRRYFINMVGLGLTPFVIQQYAAWGNRLKLGSVSYLIATAASLFKYKGGRYYLSNENDFQFQGQLLSFNIGIGQYCGGGIRLAPKAVPYDEQFDFTLIHPLAVWRILANLPKLFNGKILNHPQVDHHRGAAINISAPKAFHLEADGELIPKAKAFTLSLLPQSLAVVVP